MECFVEDLEEFLNFYHQLILFNLSLNYLPIRFALDVEFLEEDGLRERRFS